MRSYYFLGAFLLLVGLAMALIPEGFIGAVVVSAGVAAIASGIFTLRTFRNLIDDAGFRRLCTIRGIAALIAGTVAIVFPLAFAKTVWTAACYLLACYLLASAALVAYAIGKLREKAIPITVYAYELAASAIIALVLFVFPDATGILLVRGTGALLAVGGIACAVYAAVASRRNPRV